MDISGRLVQLRQSRQLSQQQLAQRVGMAPSQLNRYERGVSRPALKTLEKLARGLRVQVRDLFW